MGSAPFNAMRHADRSSPSRRRSARAASAYAKLGPPVTVPRCSDIQRIQSPGDARKSCGGAIARSKPVTIGVIRRPMRPMSWYSGSHETPRSAGPSPAPSTMASMLFSRQRWARTTPFGSSVEPLVNWMMPSASGSSGGRSHARGAPRSSSRPTTGGSPGSTTRNGASCGSTTTTVASAFAIRRRVWRANSSMEPRRIGSGRHTSVAPASQVASIAVTSAREVGPSSATWSPGPMPRAWSAAATPWASS